jgi:heparanase 1
MTRALCLLLLCACTADDVVLADELLTLDVTPLDHTVSERFLSFAVDLGQVAGTVFWNPDAEEEEPESPVPPYDFSGPDLATLTAGLSPAWLRLGGTESDRLYYDLDGTAPDPVPEVWRAPLTAEQFDGAAEFATALDLQILFTLNAGAGPRTDDGAWDPTQARSLIDRAVSRDYPIGAWELGNEPNGWPLLVGITVPPAQYATDMETLHAQLDDAGSAALTAGPASAFWPVNGEFLPYLEPALAAGTRSDVVTWHYYPQQSVRCPVATRPATPETLLDPANLDELSVWGGRVEAARDTYLPEAPVWLGETGNAQCGGAPGISDRWAGTLWWADQMGLLAARGQQVVVRQTLQGSDYGLLDDDTRPRPDYWLSWLHMALTGQVDRDRGEAHGVTG